MTFFSWSREGFPSAEQEEALQASSVSTVYVGLDINRRRRLGNYTENYIQCYAEPWVLWVGPRIWAKSCCFGGSRRAQSFGSSRLSPEAQVLCSLFQGQGDHRISVSSFLHGRFGDSQLGVQVTFCVFYQLVLCVIGLHHLSPVLIRKC